MLVGIVLSAAAFGQTDGPFSYRIDGELLAYGGELSGLRGGPARRIAAAQGPDGGVDRFVENELILRAPDRQIIKDFLAAYDAEVIGGGDLPEPPEELRQRARPEVDGGDDYVLRVELGSADLSGLQQWAAALELRGEYRFSSEEALRLFAILAKAKVEDGFEVTINQVSGTNDADCVLSTTQEHPAPPLFEDAFGINSLNDRDFGVTRAWQYLDLLEPTFQPLVAFVDSSFAANADIPAGTPGYDLLDDDNNPLSTGGDWHGLLVASTGAAMLDNSFGSAGTGGAHAVPMLFRVAEDDGDGTFFRDARGIRTAVAWGADVVSISRGAECNFPCRVFGFFFGMDSLTNAVRQATKANVPVFAAAGNEEENLDDMTYLPCEIDGIICVGALRLATKRAVRSSDPATNWGSNYGSKVDIWALGTDITTTPLPGATTLSSFSHTSAAAPYAAGIAAMLKVIDPTFTPSEIQSILQTTARPSVDPRVATGQIDADAAVQAAASMRGLTVKGDRYEPNDSRWNAASIGLESYTATVALGDLDFYEVRVPDDYFDGLRADLSFARAGGGNELVIDAFQQYLESLPGETSTAGATSASVSASGILSPDAPTWLYVAGQDTAARNCYEISVEAKRAVLPPDAFDDGVFPDGSSGEPRNDDAANAADLQLVQSTNPADWLLTVVPGTDQIGGQVAKASATDLNFDTEFDIDWFRIRLDPNFTYSPEIGGECPTYMPSPPSGSEVDAISDKGSLSIQFSPIIVPQSGGFIIGRSIPVEATLYNSSGTVVSGPTVRANKWSIRVDCPSSVFPDGVALLKVNPGGDRTFYRIDAKYREPFLIVRTDLALPSPEDLGIPDLDIDINWIGPHDPGPKHLVYPGAPRLIDQCVLRECPDDMPADRLLLAWPEPMRLDVRITALYPDISISYTLHNRNGNQLAASVPLFEEALPAQRLTVDHLEAGHYALKVHGDGLQPYVLEFR